MQKYAFRMRLHPGREAEYKRRHDDIWPELASLLRDAGISDYSIHLDRETGLLFGVLWRAVRAAGLPAAYWAQERGRWVEKAAAGA